MGALLLIGAGLALLQAFGVSVCVFHRLTGLPCLTCGSTRAAVLLLTGEARDAFFLQPFATAGGLLAGAGCFFYAVNLFLWRRVARVWLEGRETRVCVCAVIALALLNWLYLVWRGV
jgi:hypothetical protein